MTIISLDLLSNIDLLSEGTSNDIYIKAFIMLVVKNKNNHNLATTGV